MPDWAVGPRKAVSRAPTRQGHGGGPLWGPYGAKAVGPREI